MVGNIFSLNSGECQSLPPERLLGPWVLVYWVGSRAAFSPGHLAKLGGTWQTELGTNHWQCLGLFIKKKKRSLWNGGTFQPVPSLNLCDLHSGKGLAMIPRLCRSIQGCRNLQGHAPNPGAVLHSHGTFLALMLCWSMMIPCLWMHLLNGNLCSLGIIGNWLNSPGWEMVAGETIWKTEVISNALCSIQR